MKTINIKDENIKIICPYCEGLGHKILTKRELRKSFSGKFKTRNSIKKIQELLSIGMSLGEIGKVFGVTRQRVHQIVKEHNINS